MRIAHIIDPLIGVMPDVYLTAGQDVQWLQDHLRAFEQVCTSAVKHGAEAILITGRLFAESYVTDAVVTNVLEIIGKQPCPLVWLPDKAGAQYLRSRENIPENLSLLNNVKNCEFVYKDVRIFVWQEKIKPSGGCNILLFDELSAAENVLEAATVLFPHLRYAVSGGWAFICQNGIFRDEQLAKIENTGFEDSKKSGYYLLKLEDGRLKGRGKIEMCMHSFNTVQIDVEAGDELRDVYGKCVLAASDFSKRDFVRIILNGPADAETFVRAEQLRDKMKSGFFYLEVFNNCRIEPDEEAYDVDISLKSEFVRSVLADDTLSETEKSRVIQCGRSALYGKELSE